MSISGTTAPSATMLPIFGVTLELSSGSTPTIRARTFHGLSPSAAAASMAGRVRAVAPSSAAAIMLSVFFIAPVPR
jgi:hypothetical protein